MDLASILQQEPLDKLVTAYIQLELRESDSNVRERAKKEVPLLNSVLIALVEHKQGMRTLLTEVKCALEVNENDRKCMQRAANLMCEVIKRSQHLLFQATNQIVTEIVALACEKAFIAVCGNAFIALLNQVCLRVDLYQQQSVALKLLNFLVNPKLLVSTYRQETRLCLYRLYLKVLDIYRTMDIAWKNDPQNQNSLIERCISSGGGEKDPRNIGSVFELYLNLLQVFPEMQLAQHKTQMFENLQSYYPIEFIGDEDNQQQRKINIQEISSLLDQCLTHHFFRAETWELFSAKTAAPPIAPFVPTFLLYLSRRRVDSESDFLTSRLKNMLIRLCEDEFIDEDYEDGQPDLGNVFVAILDTLFCRANEAYSLQGYRITMNFLERMIDKVVIAPCKNSGAMMGIFRCFVKQSSHSRFRTLVELFRSYSLQRVLKVLQNQEDIVPKLGLAIVALSQTTFASQNLEQIVGLLILQVGKLYPEVTDEIKMLLLKILLQAYKGYPKNRLMVRTANDSFILKDCLSRAKWAFENSPDPTQAYLVKAFIDFITSVYINKLDAILQNVQGANFELQTYLLGRLYEVLCQQSTKQDIQHKKKEIVSKLNLLVSSLKTEEEKEGIAKGLAVIEPTASYELLSSISWKKQPELANFATRLLLQLKKRYQKSRVDEEETSVECEDLKGKMLAFLKGQRIGSHSNTLLQEIWCQISGDQHAMVFPGLGQLHKFSLQEYKFESRFKEGYEPTLIHWLWQHLDAIQSQQSRQNQARQLLECLPERILLRDSEKILQLLIKSQQQGSSLVKIVKHLEISTLQQTGIIQHCVDYVQRLCDQADANKTTESSVSILAVLIAVLEKDRGGSLKKELSKLRKQWKKLMLNRKRPIRQAARKIVLLLQE